MSERLSKEDRDGIRDLAPFDRHTGSTVVHLLDECDALERERDKLSTALDEAVRTLNGVLGYWAKAERPEDVGHDVLECRIVESPFGQALLVRVHRNDMQPMGYSELYDVLQEHYPARWWLQSGPWPERLLDQANKYHVWVLQEGMRPACFDLFEGD